MQCGFIYVTELIHQKQPFSSTFHWTEALQRFCRRFKGVVSVFVKFSHTANTGTAMLSSSKPNPFIALVGAKVPCELLLHLCLSVQFYHQAISPFGLLYKLWFELVDKGILIQIFKQKSAKTKADGWGGREKWSKDANATHSAPNRTSLYWKKKRQLTWLSVISKPRVRERSASGFPFRSVAVSFILLSLVR